MNVIRHRLFNPALFLLLFAGAFTFDGLHMSWLWAGEPGVAAALLLASALCWVLLWRSLHKHLRVRGS